MRVWAPAVLPAAGLQPLPRRQAKRQRQGSAVADEAGLARSPGFALPRSPNRRRFDGAAHRRGQSETSTPRGEDCKCRARAPVGRSERLYETCNPPLGIRDKQGFGQVQPAPEAVNCLWKQRCPHRPKLHGGGWVRRCDLKHLRLQRHGSPIGEMIMSWYDNDNLCGALLDDEHKLQRVLTCSGEHRSTVRRSPGRSLRARCLFRRGRNRDRRAGHRHWWHSFQRARFWKALRSVPAGSTTRYGALAARGRPGREPRGRRGQWRQSSLDRRPCHRIIGSAGALTAMAADWTASSGCCGTKVPTGKDREFPSDRPDPLKPVVQDHDHPAGERKMSRLMRAPRRGAALPDSAAGWGQTAPVITLTPDSLIQRACARKTGRAFESKQGLRRNREALLGHVPAG